MMVYPFKIRKANIWLSIILLLAGSIVKAQPSITNFSPTSGAVGTLVTIKGANIQNPTQIIIGGVNAIPISSQGNTLVAMVMPGAVTGGISVTTSGGVINSTENFIVTPTQPPNAQLGAKLLGTGAVGNAQQGSSVSVSADGNTMIIGGRGDNNFAGAAWIFTRSGAGWVQEGTKLVGTGAVSINSQQGYSVAMSADGKTAMIGGYNDDGGKGAVWVFIRNGANWNQQGSKLVATDANADANMGSSIALSADGNTAIIGGYNDNGGIGAAWIFTRTGSVWSQSQKLIFSGESGNPNFGKSVAISADGTTAIIGGNADNSFKGASWIFVNSGGNFLQQGNKLVGTGASGGVAQQGWSVNLSADGNTAIVGGLYDVNKGAAWIFTRSGTNWVQQGSKLIGTGDIDGANQGSSVSLSADGNTAIIGGYQDNSGMGAIWVFTRNGIIWTQQGTKLVGTGATSNAKQGQSVAISANGNTVVVGGNGDDGSKGATWAFTYFPTPSISQFSPTVAATGTTIAITGTNLLGTTSINLGGALVASFTVISSTSIIAVVGNGNSGNMSITTPGGTATLAGFSFIPPPTITGFSPSTAGAGANLMISGTNLNGTSLITLGGTLVSAFTIVSPTSIIAVVGNGSSGAISLTTPGGTASIEGFNFIPPPTITSINPNSVGAGGLITITGTNLIGTFEITLGGTTVQAFTVVSSTSIVAVVGGGTSGGISLTTPGGSASLGGFIFVQPPLISSFSSTFGPVGSLVTINGSNLNNLLSVFIAGVGAIPISNDGNKLVAMVMPGATSGGVSVVTVGGTAVGTGNFSVTSSQPPNAQQGNKLVGTGAVNAARQGKSIAVSADGNTAIVGGYFDNGFRGAAWVYTRNGDTWVQQGNKLVVNDAIGNSNFGWSVAISADGNTAMVGGPADNFNIGAVWIFNRTENSWIQQAKLIGSGYIGRAQQGVGVAMSADGNTIIVGGDRDNSLIGAAWVFKRSGNIWTQQGAKLVGSNSIGQSQQGWNVSISGDGNTAILGGFGDNGGNGAAWVFTQNGNDWIQQGNKLFGNDGIGNSQQGWNVSLNADGNTAILGGYNDDGGVGAAWIFTRTGNIWSQQGNKLIGTGVQGVALQGADVALSADGNIALVGGHIDNNQVGAAWIFKRSGGSWTQVGNKLKAKDAIGASWMGYELALSADGNTAILGGLFDNGTNGASWAFTYIPPPTITTFSPIAAGKGDVISIFGTNFSGTTAINLGGTAVDVFTVVSSTSIVAIVGTGATGAVSLVAPGGIASLDGFTFIPAPTITSFSPIAAAKGTVITIIGTNLTGSFLITLGGTSVQNFTVVDSTTIEAVVGDGSSGELRVTSLGGTAALSGFTFIPPPTITSFTPSTAATGELISITGNHFNGTSIISLGGTLVSAFTIINSNSIVATVGNGSSGALSITTPGGSASLNGFIFIPPPAITSFIPTTAASGAIITINGNNLNGTSSLALGGTPVSAFTVVSASSILAQVGAGSTGAVSVTTPGGSASLNGFIFIPPPAITSFVPTTAASGAIITINGNNLNGTSSLALGGTPVSAFTVVSASSILAQVGAGSTGAMSLTTRGGSASLNGFIFIPPPAITSFAPSSAASGAILTINGNNLNGTSSLALGGTPVSAFTVVSASSILVQVGAGSSGAVSVTTPGGSAILNGFIFIPPPAIASFAPTSAASGAIITINGNNLNGTSSLALGGTPVSAFTVVSASSILAQVGAGSTGAVSVTTPGGSASLNGFIFIPPPAITSFAPSSAASGGIITINGNNLNGTSSLALGGTPVSAFTVVSASSILVQVGAGSSGAVSVTTPGGSAILNGFIFIPPPAITSFAPSSAASGAIITINGNNLNGTSSLALGGTPVSAFTVVSASSILARVGAGSTGAVSVTTPGGSASLNGFIFIPPPAITSFAPTSAASGAILTINGNNLNGTSSLALGGTPVSAFTVVSASAILARVGTGSTGAVSVTTPGGSASLNGFIFIPPPAITSFAPSSAASGAIITINGNNLNGTSSLALGGTPVSAFTVVSASSILARVGAGSTGAVSVTTPGGSASLNGFIFIPAPTIVSFTPGTTKAGGILTITGTNFEGTYSISLGGTLVRSFTIVSTTMIVAEVGNGSSGELRVTTLGGSASLNGFKFIPAPTITNFNPGKAKSGGIITITGNNFDSTFTTTIGGTAVRSFTVVSSNSILAEVGNGSSGAIQVTTPGGSASLEGFTFILPPILYDFYPKMAGSGKLISITGANFNDVIAISLGGTKVSSFKRISESNLLAVVSNGSSGTLSLVTAGGAVELSGFVFIPPPVITSFTPSSASTGSMLTITGEHFVGISKVTLGGIPVASFEVLSTTTMWAVVGSGASGSVYVSSFGGDTRKEGFTFLYYPPNFIPAISNAFSPNGDGINDYWRLDILKDYPKATVQVFTRLGQLVFSGIGYHQPWDGRYKAELLPVGTYYYTVDLQNGKPPLTGSVSIIY